ncbi:MAG: C40 family peptidase [Flavobacteriales bacterium]
MNKITLLAVLIPQCTLLIAQEPGSEASVDSAMLDFFSSHGVVTDSCSKLPLYDEICSWIETPYCYGGLTKKCVDCSGLVKNIYKIVYQTELHGGSGNIFRASVPVERKYLTEGDLLFFKIDGKRISHMGIYLGNNSFVHASTQRGVIISDLDEPYYSRSFAGAGHPAPSPGVVER